MVNSTSSFDNSQVPEYNEQSFWSSVKQNAKKMGSTVLNPALTLYYTMQDSNTPGWAKTVIVGGLAYLVFPADAVPDIIPVIGLTDDIATLTAASATVAMHVTEEHVEKAKNQVDSLLG